MKANDKSISFLHQMRQRKKKNNFRMPIVIAPPLNRIIPSPVLIGYLQSVRITVIERKDEVHFVLQPPYGVDEQIFHAGSESSTCMNVMLALKEYCVDREIENVYFYGIYDGSWKQISFAGIDPDQVDDTWPDSNSGNAFIGISVNVITNAEVDYRTLSDDYESPAFPYWLHVQQSANKTYEEQFNEIMSIRGSIAVSMTARFLFSISRERLVYLISEAQGDFGFISSTDICNGYRDVGFGCYSISYSP